MTVPEGYEIEIAAAAPLTERPMIVNFDDQGRLYIAESSGSNDKVQQQLIDKPHSILRLEDTDGDGKFDRRTVFADKMMLPEGVLWHDGSVYVGAPPQLWKLTDTDDDGVADQREVFFDGKTLTNCANDMHGPYLGLDGWIYWTKGAFAEQTYERPGREPLVTKAAHIFRRRPEGGPIEAVLTGGMDNPVEVAFTPEGERLLTSTFLEQPRLGRRDGIIHAVYGGVYGKVHGVTDSHPMTGGYLPAMTHLGPAAPVGLAYAEAGEARGDLFATLFNMHKVIRVALTPAGATYTGEPQDFLVSDSMDFHPTDVTQDADGSLLVVDTGAWYKICCPTSQLSKPDVLGAIYRIRKTGAPRVDDPRGLSMPWDVGPEELVGRLGDERPAVRHRAIAALAKQGEPAVAALAGISPSASTMARRNAVWALTRISGEPARAAVRAALQTEDESVGHAATHSVSVWRDAAALEALLAQVQAPNAPLQRAAAEALGRLGDPKAAPALLDAVGATEDEILTHSLTYALIEIADPAAVRPALRSTSPRVRRAAMIALDQMQPAALEPATVLPLLTSNEPLLAETASWIATQHPDWGGALSGYFRSRLAKAAAGGESLEAQLGRFTADPAIQKLLAESARSGNVAALRVMAKAPLKEIPESWRAAVVAALGGSGAAPLEAAVQAARAWPQPEKPDAALQAALLRVGRNDKAPDAVRAAALDASVESLDAVDPLTFDFLLARVAPDQPVPVRGPAARALSRAPLSTEQLTALTAALPPAGPMELPLLVEAFGASSDGTVGEKWVVALADARGLANLRPDILEKAAAPYPEPVQKKAAALLAGRADDRAADQQKLQALLAELPEGDVRRGQAVFNSSEASCSSCHAIGYAGGRIGPGLTKIGEIRSRQDLLEAVVFPSASFVRSFEPLVIQTQDDIFNGVPIEEDDAQITLALNADDQARILRADIEEVRPGTVSVMPSGLADQLSRQQLADLLAFLEATRWGAR
ncbi:MAG: c-type cytochrome [Acidobacteria bacterium]|nr:c-type cytochrome [Acidobacteriota bacterium]